MKKKLLYFKGECKNSIFFIIMLLVALTLCMCLINVAMQIISTNNSYMGYYKHSMAENVFVEFSQRADITIGDIKKDGIDVATIATSSVIGNVDGQDVRVVTPTVVNKMPKQGLKFSKTLPNDYREIYVDELVAKDLGYEKDKFYDMVIQSDNERIQRVKVLGLIDSEKVYYKFDDFSNMLTKFQEIIMCDNLSDNAVVKVAIFADDIDPLIFKTQGHIAIKGIDLFNENSRNSVFIYLGLIVAIVTALTILTNYLVNIDKMRKRFAVQFVCGVDYKTIYGAEIVKMSLIYIVATLINVVLTAVFKDVDYSGASVMSFNSLGHAIWIVGSIYLVTLCIGMFKLTKIKPLESVTDEIND